MADVSSKRSNASCAARAFGIVLLGSLAWTLGAAAQPATAPATGDAANPCTNYNLVPGALVTARGVSGATRTTQDSVPATEGTVWNSPMGVSWQGSAPELVYDLHAPAELQFFVLQGDNNDNYTVEGSIDGSAYRLLWTAEPDQTGAGLRTRFVTLPKRESARYLRIKATGGDGYYSLSELRAYCKQPVVWPPHIIKPPVHYDWHGIDNDVMVWIKMICAGFGVLVLIAIWALEATGKLYPRKHKRWRPRWGYFGAILCGAFIAWNLYYIISYLTDGKRTWMWLGVGLSAALVLALIAYDLWRPLAWRRGDSALALAGLLGFFGWWNFGHYHFDHYVHIWEHYHYYVGAKYGPELRYSRIYMCTSAADVLDGMRARVKKREMRDLAVTNELGPSDAIAENPQLCTKYFSTERWAAFRDDIRFFRNHFPADRWDESQTDHGYNGTPVWAIAGRLIANYGPLTWTKIQIMACIDSALLVLMWLVSLWAFGWRASCVGMMWWGFNFPARYYWNGGSLLRYDWIFWLVVGICLLKKRYHFGAGMALTYATLLRVFPGFVVAALILKALARIVRQRRFVISRGHLRFAMGCVLALAVLIPASSWATGGLDAWKEFAQNSKKHLSTPLTNNMGLKTALGYDADTSAKYLRNGNLHDPFADWKHARNFYYGKRRLVLGAILLLFCIVLARASDREPDWVAACLGTGLIAMASELTCYYYGFLLAYGLLWERRKLAGVLATALAGLTCLLSIVIEWNDDHFAGMSLATSIVIVGVTALIAYGPRLRSSREARTSSAPAPVEVPAHAVDPATAPFA